MDDPPLLPLDEPRRLQALLRLGLLDTPAEERFDRIVRMAARMFQVPISLVSLLDESRQWFKARVGLDTPSTARGISFCGHAILTPYTFVVRDALEDPRFADNPLVTGTPHVRFYAGHPIHASDGSPVGTLCLLDRRARDFTEAERQQLEDMASWVELELNALSMKEARTALAQQERFFELSVDMLCIAGLDGTFRQLGQAWTRTLGYSEQALLARPLLELVHEEERAATAEWLARGARASHSPASSTAAGARTAPHWLQWNATVNVEEGIFYGVARNVTEQKRLEAEQRQVELMKSEFVSTVSHELRTPLTSIRGSLGLLEGGILGSCLPRPRTWCASRGPTPSASSASSTTSSTWRRWSRASWTSSSSPWSWARCSPRPSRRTRATRRSATPGWSWRWRHPAPERSSMGTASSRCWPTCCPTRSSSPPAASASRCGWSGWARGCA
ncbi:GAF domain-containing protein [Cystobacter fuscus]